MKKIIIILCLILHTSTFASDLIFKNSLEALETISGTLTGLQQPANNNVIGFKNSVVMDLFINNIKIEELIIDGNGVFSFNSNIEIGSLFRVQILTHPTDPIQECILNNQNGVVAIGGFNLLQVLCGSNSTVWDTSNWDESNWQ